MTELTILNQYLKSMLTIFVMIMLPTKIQEIT